MSISVLYRSLRKEKSTDTLEDNTAISSSLNRSEVRFVLPIARGLTCFPDYIFPYKIKLL